MRSPRRLLLASLLVALPFASGPGLAQAAAPAASPTPAPTPLPAQAPAGFELRGDAARGATLFAKRCRTCHGPEGRGDGQLAATLDPHPGDLTDARRMARYSDYDLYRLIRDGGPALGLSSKMIGWARLSPDQDLRDLAAHARTLAAPAR
jgi:high-affinity iron transporter